MSYIRKKPYHWVELKESLKYKIDKKWKEKMIDYIKTLETHQDLVEFALDLLGDYWGYKPYGKVHGRIKERNEIINNLKKANGYDLWHLLWKE